jgi:ferritin
MNNKFIKPPLSKIEKEKKAEDFLNFSTENDTREKIQEIKSPNERVLKKEDVKALLLRFPLSMAQDIREISALTGISRNAVCIELLRSAVREKLKELKS